MHIVCPVIKVCLKSFLFTCTIVTQLFYLVGTIDKFLNQGPEAKPSKNLSFKTKTSYPKLYSLSKGLQDGDVRRASFRQPATLSGDDREGISAIPLV